MDIGLSKWLYKRYPQNYIIRNPLIGSIAFLGFCIIFVIIYKPFQVHESRYFSYGMTVTIYCVFVSLVLIGWVKALKNLKYFSDSNEWSILKELVSVVLSLAVMGIAVYFAGFLMEPPIQRWNLHTFFDSLLSSFLIFALPFGFFTIINYRYLLVYDIIKNYNTDIRVSTDESTEELIHIESQLKKEELLFYPGQLIYAESEGNYIAFHLNLDGQVKKRLIRNSISNIEVQLSGIPFIFRVHRAFIVNVNKIKSQKGNSLGYRLKLSGTDDEIPVSRQKTQDFDQLMKQYH
jgi:LytTr DNA-binding domain